MDIRLTERINSIQVSPTLAVAAEAERYKARGLDVVDFGPGEPDFPTPDHIKQAAIEAIHANQTKYTATGGIAPLRAAIAEWHASQFGSRYSPQECIVCVGGKHAIFNAVSVLIGAGDEVLIPSPYWVSFPDIVKYAGGAPVIIETRAAEGFCLSAAQVEAAITPRTRMLIVNSPCNPSGAVISQEEFERISGMCSRRGIWLLSDECYSHFVYSPARPWSVGSLTDARPGLIVVGSLSKTFSMTGWRVGYALAPQGVVDAMIKLQSQSTSNPTSIAQYAALGALRGPMDGVAVMLAEYARRRERILAGLAAIPGITCSRPQGAFYVFPDVRALLDGRAADDLALSRRLLEVAHIAVVPGQAFGAPGYIRISYATSLERIEEGLRRLSRFFRGARAAS